MFSLGGAHPLTLAKAAPRVSSNRVPFAVSLVPALRRYPIGALFGLVLTGLATLAFDLVPDRFWLEVPISLICVPGCMLLERLIDWRFSGKVDARMRHAAAHEDARQAFEKLEDYQARGIINKPDAHKIGAVIAKRDVAGGPRTRRQRVTRRRDEPAPPADSRQLPPGPAHAPPNES